MSVVKVIDREGIEHVVDAAPGLSVMEILRDAGLPIEATCGGQCICSTCHVYVDSGWFARLEPRNDTEQVLVEDSGHYQENSRLSCQIDFEPGLDGLALTLAPEY